MAMPRPNWKSSRIGWVMSTANVPARMTPADEIMPPVRTTATRNACVGSWWASSCRYRVIMKIV